MSDSNLCQKVYSLQWKWNKIAFYCLSKVALCWKFFDILFECLAKYIKILFKPRFKLYWSHSKTSNIQSSFGCNFFKCQPETRWIYRYNIRSFFLYRLIDILSDMFVLKISQCHAQSCEIDLAWRDIHFFVYWSILIS